MNDKDRQLLPPLNGHADLPERLWAYDDFAAEEDQPAADFAGGLASLGFIRAAVRRCAWLWCATAAIGFVGGLAVSVLSPPAYQASTSVLLTHNSSDNPVDAMQTDLALADSNTVAERTMHKLGLQGNPSSFIAAATVRPTTDRVLVITFSATSSSQAVLRVETLAAEFLQFRAEQLQTQQQLVSAGLNQQIDQAKQHINSISAQISQLSAQPASHSQRAQIRQLTTQRTNAVNALGILEQTTNANQASAAASAQTEIKGSQVLDAAAPVHHSALKYALMYAAIGLVVGLALGLGIVIIRALVSDRLRRRDDIAEALGASVSISAGHVHTSRWLLGWPGRRAARDHDMQRIVRHLRDALPERTSGTAALAVVSVDNAEAAAQCLVSVALSCAREGQQVVVADLCDGAPMAHLLGEGKPGVHMVTSDGAQLGVAVPRRDEVMPVGPVRPSRLQPPDASGDDELAAAYDSADILLTLVTLDPFLGADHLRTWAADAVVVVTAGRSTWTRIHAVGEMIRLARISLVSAILIGADKTDESLGMTQAAARPSAALRIRGL